MAANTLMWEAKAPDGHGPELLDWVVNTAVPTLRADDGVDRVDVFVAADDRVVVIAVGDAPPRRLPDPPDQLSERPPHAWPFRQVTD
ncbi:MAG TPA: hypothetical protein VHW44_20730 [Pseudonocardiaceae bacterium]|jgi:hypothetical protein|nr:hypothetical protein [Pseudonocardiaceae bacterium]